MNELLILFIVLNAINVIIQTIKIKTFYRQIYLIML